MPDQNKAPTVNKNDGPKKSNASDKKTQKSVSSGTKEHEPASADALMAEIQSASEAQDRAALERLQGSMSEIKRSEPEVELSPDVEDAGVHSPQKVADDVVKKGSEIELSTTEETYKQGQKLKLKVWW